MGIASAVDEVSLEELQIQRQNAVVTQRSQFTSLRVAVMVAVYPDTETVPDLVASTNDSILVSSPLSLIEDCERLKTMASQLSGR